MNIPWDQEGPSTQDISITLHAGLSEISAQAWDRLACPEAAFTRPMDPFTTYRFFKALENSGSIGAGTGWEMRPMSASLNGTLIGIMPLFLKLNSQGEYIFDHNWAQAYERAGGQYYPKLQVAVPFTPATGRRFLTDPAHQQMAQIALIQGAQSIAVQNGLSSFHVTFCTGVEAKALEKTNLGMMHRVTQQFHWQNQGYKNFDDFLAQLSSRKRKAIRKERAMAVSFGGTIQSFTGDKILPCHWDYFWQFYQDTSARKWGTPYLTRACFDEFHITMRQDILLVLAFEGDRPIAGALNFIGRDRLFGRYWGATVSHPCLHFELCYYQAIDWAIAHGLSYVEAGAQGEHKLARGYLPSTVHSLHWLREDSFAAAISQYLKAERHAVDEEINILTNYGPFRKIVDDLDPD
ncbi:MAG: putative N-acyltransferase [Paracoccaceae bacterium]